VSRVHASMALTSLELRSAAGLTALIVNKIRVKRTEGKTPQHPNQGGSRRDEEHIGRIESRDSPNGSPLARNI